MRDLLIFCLALIVPGGMVAAQSNISLLDEDSIRGNRISGITEWNHAWDQEKPKETGTISLKARYNENGYMIEETTFNAGGQESRKITSSFDNMGNRTEYKIFDSRSKKLTFSEMARFDQHGNKIAEWGFDGLGNYRNVYHLNPDGRVKEIHYNTQGTLKEKRVFSYSGNETEVSVVLPDNTVSQTILLQHNETGDLIEEAYYDDKNNLLKKTEYDYDRKGLKTNERRYQGGKMQYSNSYLYNNGLLMKVIKNDGEENETVTNLYTYDDEGQMVKEAWYNENVDDYSTKQYSWDDQGNMTSVVCYYASYRFNVMYRYDYNFFN